jgi:TolA-binding protein
MLERTMAITWVLAAGLSVSAGGTLEWQHPDVEKQATVLASDAASPEDRAAALDALREAARGQPRDALTREAIFALALLLEDEEQQRPEEALNQMKAAVAYYPEDPRSGEAARRLATRQLEADRHVEAHFSLVRLLQRTDLPEDPALLARAAANAVAVGDMSSALDWASRVDVDALPFELHETLWLSRLMSAASLGRHSEATEAVGMLDALGASTLRRNADALLAAARVDAAVGRLEDAAARFEAFINIHPRHSKRPEALLEHGRLLARLQHPAAAIRTFEWMLEEYPRSAPADEARLSRVEVDPGLTPAERAEAYRTVASHLLGAAHVSEACQRIVETLLAAGMPLEAISTLGWMAKHAEGPPAFAARTQLAVGLEPAMALLADRGDNLGLAAVAAEADSVGIALPSRLDALARAARRRLGLTVVAPEPVGTARTHARAGRWDQVATVLDGDSADRGPGHGASGAESERLRAEADWREGRDREALQRIDAALTNAAAEDDARALHVLRADIRFSTGEQAAACADYLAASRVAATPWVERQLAICASGTARAEDQNP